jgi:hypothetical protein
MADDKPKAADAPKNVPAETPHEIKEKEPIKPPQASADIPEQIPVYNVNDALIGRNGGPYLDEELAKEQEVRNARAEGREPDFSNLAAAPSPGIQLVTEQELLLAHRGRGVNIMGSGAVNAPAYGYVPNPALAFAQEINDTEGALKREAEVDPRTSVVADDPGATVPDNNYKG